MEETQEQVVVKIKHSTYSKERHEANQDYILKNRQIDPFQYFLREIFLAGIFGSFSCGSFGFLIREIEKYMRNKYVRNT